MSEDRRIECPVVVPPNLAVGEYANAFRIVHDSGTEWFLDFLVFSESENTAKVVSRTRVQEAFLGAVQLRLNATMLCITEERAKATTGTAKVVILDQDIN